MKAVFLFLIFTFTFSFAQTLTLPLWDEKVPNQNEIKVEEADATTDKLRITAVDKPEIEVYLPAKHYATGEAVIILPGGGYRILAYNHEGVDVAKMFNSKGIAGIVVKYRLPITENNIDGKISPFLDAQRAVRLTRFNAADWGIDSNKIGIMGFSAGGHLASTLGTHFNEEYFTTDEIDKLNCKPDFMILMYPVITFKQPYLHMGSRTNLIGANPTEELINFYSNELQVTKETPPTFLIHAQDDEGVPVENSINFFKSLKKNNVPAEIHIFQEGGHGFGLATKKGRLSEWQELCLSWIKSINE